MRYSNIPILPVHLWPQEDQRAWAAANAPGDLLAGTAGLAAHWATDTKDGIAKGYGQFLSWYALTIGSPQATAPAGRLTREVLARYIAHLRERLASTSVVSRLTDLHEAVRVMWPEQDLTLLRLARSRHKRIAAPTRGKKQRVVHSRDLWMAGLVVMEEAETRPQADTPKQAQLWAASRFRDGLIVALLALRPIRIANLTEIEIGTHLLGGSGRHRLCFPESKTGRYLEFAWPPELEEALETYLTVHREVLLHGRESVRLWVSTRGSALSEQGIYCQVCEVTKAQLGRPINPHLFRDCAATSIASDLPEHAEIIARILGHATLRTAQDYYIQADMLDASRKVGAIILALRDGSLAAGATACAP